MSQQPAITCLTEDESHAITTAWQALQATLTPLATLIEQVSAADCQDLYATFGEVTPAFDALERAIMLAHQIRAMQQAQGLAVHGESGNATEKMTMAPEV